MPCNPCLVTTLNPPSSSFLHPSARFSSLSSPSSSSPSSSSSLFWLVSVLLVVVALRGGVGIAVICGSTSALRLLDLLLRLHLLLLLLLLRSLLSSALAQLCHLPPAIFGGARIFMDHPQHPPRAAEYCVSRRRSLCSPTLFSS